MNFKPEYYKCSANYNLYVSTYCDKVYLKEYIT